ncbi:hypothetical protein C8R47DRAFT_1316869 [Mycena vitilis]|nr:hypothetical protein C8R47DRAFT_1316869 [Mycena vitilis]
MRACWFLPLLILPVLTAPTNHTLDDIDPSLQYLPLPGGVDNLQCNGCTTAGQRQSYGLDPSLLFDGTFSASPLPPPPGESSSAVLPVGDPGVLVKFTGLLSFTSLPTLCHLSRPGIAVYLFIAVPNATVAGDQIVYNFALDSVTDPVPFTFQPQETAQYNVVAYAKEGLGDGEHSLNMDIGDSILVFDRAVYTSNDPDAALAPVTSIPEPSSADSSPSIPASSSGDSSSSVPASSSSSSSSAPTASALGASTGSSTAAEVTSNPTTTTKKVSGGAVAGVVMGILALILACLVGFMLSRRAKHRVATPHMEESGSVPPSFVWKNFRATTDDSTSETMAEKEEDEAQAADRLRVLREEVQRLEQQAGSSSAGLVTAPPALGRSLSTMKREQTLALEEHERGAGVVDTLVHTDSGLRLTAGRVVDELPPTYVAD